MITNRDKDYLNSPRTIIMEAKGDLEMGDKEELYMETFRSSNFINMHQM